jgi:hypothetical protein
LDLLNVYGSTGQDLPMSVLGVPGFAAVSGDVDGDGFDDIVVSHQGDYAPEVFYNQQMSGASTFNSFVDAAPSTETLAIYPSSPAGPLSAQLGQLGGCGWRLGFRPFVVSS